jgi:hypothetical protein
MTTYFAHDGSYGPAAGMAVFDTRAWGPDDWQRIEEATDMERLAVAIDVALQNGDI